MSLLSLEICQKIAGAAMASAAELKLKPICVTILDARASLRLCVNQDGTSIHRHRIAHGKANAAIALGMGSRALGDRAEAQAYFIDAVGRMMDGDFIPVPGGVLVKNAAGEIWARWVFPVICLTMMKKQRSQVLRRQACMRIQALARETHKALK